MEMDIEIISSFKDEAKLILDDVKVTLENLEEEQGSFPKELLEEFGNKLDRLMGTAQTFSTMHPSYKPFDQIGKFSALCKATAYKASTLKSLKLVPIFAAFWLDTVDIIEEILENLEDENKLKEVTKNYIPVLQKRLMWLAQQIINQSKANGGGPEMINVDGLIKKLGLDL